MLAQRFAGRTLHKTTLDAPGANLTAYTASGDRAKPQVAIFNKDARDVEVTLHGAFRHAVVERLAAPAIDSKTGVKFEGATVGGDGQFHPVTGQALKTKDGKLIVPVPAYSAA
jgi:hypothetical protein